MGISYCLDLALGKELTPILLLGILVTWSPADVDVGIKASLTQSYPILLSTLLSINRNQLSVYDGACALALTSPPLVTYLVICSICDIFGVQTSLYKKVQSRYIIRALWILSLFLWLALSLTVMLPSRAFNDSEANGDAGFPGWLDYLFIGLVTLELMDQDFIPILIWVFTPTMVLLLFLCLFRRRSQVMADFRTHRKRALTPWSRWRISWMFVKCARCVPVVSTKLTKSHAI